MEKEIQWKQVPPRRKNNTSRHNAPIRAIRHYWQGFKPDNTQRWFIELNDGRILTENHSEYDFWLRRFYPNRRRYHH